MDFARKQLEKYGWTDGKGLGKKENGIAEALKPKLKRSVTGIGHDAASDFTEHWWTQLYNKAAGNVEVEEKNGKTKKIKTKDDGEFEITNSTWKIKRKYNKAEKEEQYADYFVRKAVLANGGSQTENTGNSETESDSEGVKRDAMKMTDEELFAACEGRTAHKGARHGLMATGKLARIAQQEQMLLTQSQYDGYSHAKKRKDEDKTPTNETVDNTNESQRRKNKKKKKNKETESENSLPVDCEKSNSDSVASNDCSRKIKKLDNNCCIDEISSEYNTAVTNKKKKKRKTKDANTDQHTKPAVDNSKDCDISCKKSKKKKLKDELIIQ